MAKRKKQRRIALLEQLESRQMMAGDGAINLVRAFETFNGGVFPSTDPSSLTYHTPTGQLIVADSEIDGQPDFNGENVWRISLDGSTLHHSYALDNLEPTGIEYSDFNGDFYVVSDQALGKVMRYNSDLSVRLKKVNASDAVADSSDVEGLAIDPATGRLYVAKGNGGAHRGILVYDADLNFLYNFDTDAMLDPEAVAFDTESGHLFLVDGDLKEVHEYTVDGDFVHAYDVSTLTPAPLNLKGATFAPTSDPNDDPAAVSLYLSDAQHDEVADGRIYETHIERYSPPSGSFDVTIAASSDDAEESAAGAVDLTSKALDFAAGAWVGMRFTNLGIPEGAVIDHAYLQFKAVKANATAIKIKFKTEATDDAATFDTDANDISGRAKSLARVKWSAPAWTLTDNHGANQKTPDLAEIVQEVVNRPGWQSGNDIAILASSKFAGIRSAKAFDKGANMSPTLHIDYHVPSGAPSAAPPEEFASARLALWIDAPADDTSATDTPLVDDAAPADDASSAPVVETIEVTGEFIAPQEIASDVGSDDAAPADEDYLAAVEVAFEQLS